MSDQKNPKISSTMWSNKPVKMKLFGAWEIDKTPSDCIPRLCSLNINRLTWNKSIGSDVNALMVAVKMQNSKRILRSNEIQLPTFSEHLTSFDIELDLSFTLQYPHFIKRNRNYLQIILQRRKKYKNKAILGYKTLACGVIDMVEVLQRSTINEKQLDLFCHAKESGKNNIIAKITISSLKSQPIDQENFRRGKISIDRPDVYSDDEDFTSAEDGSESETIEDANNIRFRRKLADHKSRKLFSNNEKFRTVVPTNVQQRNLKQKFISLLKKFRLPDSEAYDSEEKFQEALEKELMSSAQEPADIDDLFDDEDIDDLDYMTDSGQEFDDVSISSTPKPSLRPFFSSCTLVGQDKSYDFPIAKTKLREDSQETSGTEGTPETSDTSQKLNISDEPKKKPSYDRENNRRGRLFAKEKESKLNSAMLKEKHPIHTAKSQHSTNYFKDDNTSKEFVLDQLNKLFSIIDEQRLPEDILFINLIECVNQPTQSFLQTFEHRTNKSLIGTQTSNDIKFVFNYLCNKVQKFCNNNMKIISPIKIALIGSDAYVNSFLRSYVEALAIKSSEWQNYFRFFIVPILNSPNSSQLAHSMMLHKYLSSIDTVYSNCFLQNQNPNLNSITTTSTSINKEQQESSRNFDNTNSSSTALDYYLQELCNKVLNFMKTAQTLIQIPIAETMITYKDKTIDDESNQVFVPFICDVKIGMTEVNYGNFSIDEEGQTNSSGSALVQTSSSSIQGNEKSITSPTTVKEQSHQHPQTPPNSPNISGSHSFNKESSFGSHHFGEVLDLQIDYWTFNQRYREESNLSALNKKSDNCKFTLKNSFRNVQITRLPNFGEINSPSLTAFLSDQREEAKNHEARKEERKRCRQ
ncbi:homothorax 1 [Sarcoptes scabiei]|nr:homothorax 1 [Sarcoptes scabiei]